MAIPEPTRTEALAAIKDFCDNAVPAKHLDQLRVDHVVRGNSITIRELRAPWREDYGPEWSVNPRAQLRYEPDRLIRAPEFDNAAGCHGSSGFATPYLLERDSRTSPGGTPPTPSIGRRASSR